MDRTERIAALNDQLRRDHGRGKVVITRGIQALGHQAILDVLAAVAAFSDFTPDNDPYSEHDCAVMMVGGHRTLWKIDYYDTSACYCVNGNTSGQIDARPQTDMLARQLYQGV